MRSTARLRHGLAVGHDREGLERRRRQPDGVGADVAGDERATLRRGRQLDPVAVDQQPDAAVAQRDLEVAEPGVDGRPVRAGEGADLAPRQRLLGDEQEGLEGGLGQLDRRRAAGSAWWRRRRRRLRRRLEASVVDPRGSAVMRTTPGSRRSARRSRSLDAGRGPLLRPSSRGPRSDPTARPARRRSRAASSARAWPGT